MFLQIDFEESVATAVLSEMVLRSADTPTQLNEIIHAAPITHNHFGGACYYSREHQRFAWVRAYKEDADGEVHKDKIVVCFGYNTPPEDWQDQNRMKHTHVDSAVAAADAIVAFVLDDTVPEDLRKGDYHYPETTMRG